MFNRQYNIIVLLFIILCITPHYLMASVSNFDTCLNHIKYDAQSRGISTKTVDTFFSNMQLDPEVIIRDRKQPEDTFTLDQYLEVFLNLERINEARLALQKNRDLLGYVSEKFFIEPELLVALWSIETRLGMVLGEFDIVRSLTTLTCDKRRPEFFRKELLSILALIDQDRLSINKPIGSWAGAMGQLQFLPSVVEQYGIDLNGDEQIDIYNITEEVFATAANFLRQSGWQYGEQWGYILPPVDTPCNRTSTYNNKKMKFITLNESSCITIIITDNFEALLKWNRSDLFVVTVGLLFDALNNKQIER